MNIFIYQKFMGLGSNGWAGESLYSDTDESILLEPRLSELDELLYIESFVILSNDGSPIILTDDTWMIG